MSEKRVTDKEMVNWLLKRMITYQDGQIERDPLSSLTTPKEIEARRVNLEAAIRNERMVRP